MSSVGPLFSHEVRREVHLISMLSSKEVCLESDINLIYRASKRIQFMLERVAILDDLSSAHVSETKLVFYVAEIVDEIIDEIEVVYPGAKEIVVNEIDKAVKIETDPVLFRVLLVNIIEMRIFMDWVQLPLVLSMVIKKWKYSVKTELGLSGVRVLKGLLG